MESQEVEEKIKTLAKWVGESQNIVFFGGGGGSKESGFPVFGIIVCRYNQKYDFPPETILSHTFFEAHPDEFYRFYHDKMLCLDAKPNAAHKKLTQWERDGRLKAVITQNIDGLHQAAGSRNVLELHGSVHRNYCQKCHKFFDAAYMRAHVGIPRCDTCGGVIKPDVVLYEEGLDRETLERAVSYIRQADILIVGGTSLVVYPAAGLIRYYQGKKLVLINKGTTAYDQDAQLVISAAIGKVMEQLP